MAIHINVSSSYTGGPRWTEQDRRVSAVIDTLAVVAERARNADLPFTAEIIDAARMMALDESGRLP